MMMRAYSLLAGVALVAVALVSSPGCLKEKDDQAAQANPNPTAPVKANVDTVGTKGKNRGGYLSTVVAERYRAADRLDLMTADYNLKLYQASTGRLPADMEEYQRELIDNPQYQVKLPELPEGMHYEYDPDEGPVGTLWVVPDGQSLDDAGGNADAAAGGQ